MKTIFMALLLGNTGTLSNMQKVQVRKLEKRLLAPCCYAQSIAEHGSDIAAQMRAEVTEMVAEGRTEEEIVNYYKSLYGDRILIVPDGLTGRILFALPVVTSVLASLVLLVFFRRMLRSTKQRDVGIDQPKHAVNEALREKIAREIGEPL